MGSYDVESVDCHNTFSNIFSFNKKESTSFKTALNLENINVVEVLSKQQFECRSSSDFIFLLFTTIFSRFSTSTINFSSSTASSPDAIRAFFTASLIPRDVIEQPFTLGTNIVFFSII